MPQLQINGVLSTLQDRYSSCWVLYALVSCISHSQRYSLKISIESLSGKTMRRNTLQILFLRYCFIFSCISSHYQSDLIGFFLRSLNFETGESASLGKLGRSTLSQLGLAEPQVLFSYARNSDFSLSSQCHPMHLRSMLSI